MIGMIFQKISAIMLIACSKAVVDVCTVNLDNFKVFFYWCSCKIPAENKTSQKSSLKSLQQTFQRPIKFFSCWEFKQKAILKFCCWSCDS